MKKFISLFKATTKGDMSVFRFKGEGKSNKSKIALFLGLLLIMMFVSYTYADMFATPLHEVGLTYIVLTIFSLVIVVLNLMEGIYKSQGILFDAKDNNLVFSLPINRGYILTVRIIKILIFDYIFEIMFFVPAVIRYVMLEKVDVLFYVITLMFMVVLPLIPIVISCIIGYLIKAISSIAKNKKMIQVMVSLVLFFGIYAISFNLEGFVDNVVTNGASINDMISKIYLPIGLYVELISKFDIIKLIELLIISIAPFVLFVLIFQRKYDKIINSSKETNNKKSKKKSVGAIQPKSVLQALIKKEVKTYFSIPIYVINTIIGPLIAIFAAIGLCIKYDSVITLFVNEDTSMNVSQIVDFAPLLVILIIAVLTCMTTISSSSISLEGEKISLMKSLPVDTYKVLLGKVLCSDIIIVPAMLVSAIIMIIKLEIFNYYAIFIALTVFLVPHLVGTIGILANLKYPKLNFQSEIEVVKQSMAVLVSIMGSLVICFVLIVAFCYFETFVGQVAMLIIIYTFLIGVTIYSNYLLKTWGIKKYNEIN